MPKDPTPTKILDIRGSWRAKARRKRGEPQLAAQIPDAPSWLSPDGQAQYTQLAAQLVGPGIITATDQTSLALLADALALYVYARDQALDDNFTTPTMTGETVHPMVRTMWAAWDRVMKGCIQYGLTPAARARIVAAPPGDARASGKQGKDKKRFFRA